MCLRAASRIALAVLFVAAGVLHFTHTQLYVSIMPPYLPQPHLLVRLSGLFEILGGVGLLPHVPRRFAGYGLIALSLAVFPANIHMAMHAEKFPVAPFWLWLRLSMQGVLVAWIWWSINDEAEIPPIQAS